MKTNAILLAAALALSACAAPSAPESAPQMPQGIEKSMTDGYILKAHAVASGLLPADAGTDLFFKVTAPNEAVLYFGENPEVMTGKTSVDHLEFVCGQNPAACYFKEQ